MTAKRNVFLALRFEEAPELHLTLRYYKGATPELERELTAAAQHMVDPSHTSREARMAFPLEFPVRDMLGPRFNVRVLLAHRAGLPAWVEALRVFIDPPEGESYRTFNPHVSTGRAPCTLRCTSVALMCKDKVLHEWPLVAA